MHRFHVLLAGIMAGVVSTSALAQHGATRISPEQAREIHDRLLTIDTHIDIGSGYATSVLDPGGFTNAQVDLPKMRAGGLDAGFFVVYTPQSALDAEGYENAHQVAENNYAAIDRMIRAYPDQIGQARSADEIIEIAATGRLAALIGIENAYPLGPSVEEVAKWAARGAKYVSLTHFGNNQFGASSNPRSTLGDGAEDEGLTALGRELIQSLNDHGIMIDISHVGKRSGLEAIALSEAPVIASHSGARAVFDNPRNLDDEQLRAIADSGGVAQMVAYRSYIADTDPDMRKAVRDLLAEFGLNTAEARAAATPEMWSNFRQRLPAVREEYPDVTLSQFVDHIDHAVAVAGIDHVGMSGDFDGGGGVKGWDNAAQSPNVTLELLRRGYTESDIAKLWGGNVMRVMRANEELARKRTKQQ